MTGTGSFGTKGIFKAFLNAYLDTPCFQGTDSFFVEDDPFRRPIWTRDLEACRLFDPAPILPKEAFCSPKALLAQRILANIYEQDLMFLPARNMDWQKYQEFYSSDHRRLGEFIRPDLERMLFGFLKAEIEVGGGWTLPSFQDHCEQIIGDVVRSGSTLSSMVENAPDPVAAAKFFLIQCAPDFLSEASAMARNCLGSYGTHLSELFKILIDEYGYGVHGSKHSQAFVSLMESIGMDSAVHHYWQFYTASSLGLSNYFHYLCKNHGFFFKYLGALYYTEATLAHLTGHQARMLKNVFGESADTFYFEEHSHIDQHHARMVLEQIIKPIVHQYGDRVLVEILAGFEEFRWLQSLADEDCARQIGYHAQLPRWLEIGTAQWQRLAGQVSGGRVVEEPRGAVSIIHCHDGDHLLAVMEGELEFMANPFGPITLRSGEAMVVPRHRIHGSKVLSRSCAYRALALPPAS